MGKNIRLAWLGLAGLLLVAILYLAAVNGNQRVTATTIDPPRKIASLQTPLLTATGPLTLGDMHGKLVLLSIGYTNCPNYCPTTLANLRRVVELLDPAQTAQMQVVFLSVDPSRDTPEKLAAYISAFNPSFIGANATTDAGLASLVKEIGGYYKLGEPDKNGYYTVEHSTNLMLLDKAGNLRAFWSYGTEPSQIAADLRLFVQEK